MMRFLSALLLLLTSAFAYGQTVPNVASGMRLPGAIEATQDNKTVRISPTFDAPDSVVSIKFIVISTAKVQPKSTVSGTGATSSIEVETPTTIQDVTLVYVYGTFKTTSGSPVLSDPVATIITLHGSEPIPTPPTPVPPTPVPPTPVPPTPVPPTPVPPSNVDQVFASVKNQHAVLVVDVQTATQELAAITQNKAFFKQHFEQPNTGNHFWTYDIRATELKANGVYKKLTDASGKLLYPLPLVVVIDGSVTPAKMLTPMPVTLTGNAMQTANNILMQVAGALKK